MFTVKTRMVSREDAYFPGSARVSLRLMDGSNVEFTDKHPVLGVNSQQPGDVVYLDCVVLGSTARLRNHPTAARGRERCGPRHVRRQRRQPHPTRLGSARLSARSRSSRHRRAEPAARHGRAEPAARRGRARCGIALTRSLMCRTTCSSRGSLRASLRVAVRRR